MPDPTDTGTLNLAWARLIMQVLVDRGVTRVFVSPGSRSTPLVLAAALTPEIETIVHIDERGAAFAAQGYGRHGRPAALVCTSGTAAANYYPAVIEASMAAIPLIVLTADRPPELRGTGANQTIDQINLYGDYVRHFHDLCCPKAEITPFGLGMIIDRAILAATHDLRGPVHINCQFREPLAPAQLPGSLTAAAAASHFAGEVYAEPPWQFPAPTPDLAVTDAMQHDLQTAERPLFVFGPNGYADIDVAALTRCFPHAPVCTDILTGTRTESGEQIIAHAELLCTSAGFRKRLEPDLVVHFGGRFTAKRLSEALGTWSDCRYWRVSHDHDPSPDNTYHRDMRLARTTDANTCLQALDRIDFRPRLSPYSWPLTKDSERLQSELAQRPAYNTELTEIATCRHIAKTLSSHDGLYLSASLPIRLFDSFVGDFPGCATAAGEPSAPPRIVANRGASGIDGVVSSAAGFAMATGTVTTLVIGDLAMLHDQNGLALARQVQTPMPIVVLNNDGGGIFELLPIRQSAPEQFEAYFGTPHGMTFGHVAAQYRIPYAQPQTMADFAEAYAAARLRPGPTLIEVRTDRQQTAQLWRDAQDLAREICGD